MHRMKKLLRGALFAAIALLIVLPGLAYGDDHGRGRGRDRDRDDRPGTSDNRGRGNDRQDDLRADHLDLDDDEHDEDRVGICHLTGNGDFIFITVSGRGNAARAHERHGDLVGVSSSEQCGETAATGMVTPVVTVVRNPLGQGGAPVGFCPIAGPCTVRFSWTQPVAGTHTLQYGIGPVGTPFTSSCALPTTTNPTCDAVISAPAGTVIHYRASSTVSGQTLQTLDTPLVL